MKITKSKFLKTLTMLLFGSPFVLSAMKPTKRKITLYGKHWILSGELLGGPAYTYESKLIGDTASFFNKENPKKEYISFPGNIDFEADIQDRATAILSLTNERFYVKEDERHLIIGEIKTIGNFSLGEPGTIEFYI